MTMVPPARIAPARMVSPPLADAGTLLARALVAHAARHGLAARVGDWRTHPWASVTFVGSRHRATLLVEGDAAAWLAALPEAELRLRGHLLADLTAAAGPGAEVRIEALTLHDA